MARLTDRTDMTIFVFRGRKNKTTKTTLTHCAFLLKSSFKAIVNNRVFFCPDLSSKQFTDPNYFQFSVIFSSDVTCSSSFTLTPYRYLQMQT